MLGWRVAGCWGTEWDVCGWGRAQENCIPQKLEKGEDPDLQASWSLVECAEGSRVHGQQPASP